MSASVREELLVQDDRDVHSIDRYLEEAGHPENGDARRTLRALAARLPSPAEAVAYILHWDSGREEVQRTLHFSHYEDGRQVRFTPLYAAPPSPLADPRVREWTDAQCVQFMATALRHVEYKRGTNGPTCDDIRLGVRTALRAFDQEAQG